VDVTGSKEDSLLLSLSLSPFPRSFPCSSGPPFIARESSREVDLYPSWHSLELISMPGCCEMTLSIASTPFPRVSSHPEKILRPFRSRDFYSVPRGA